MVEFEIIWRQLLSILDANGQKGKDPNTVILSTATHRLIRLSYNSGAIFCELLAFTCPPHNQEILLSLFNGNKRPSDIGYQTVVNPNDTIDHFLTLTANPDTHSTFIAIRRLITYQQFLLRRLKSSNLTT